MAERDEREWTLWQAASAGYPGVHDGPRLCENETSEVVVPKSRATQAEAQRDKLAEALANCREERDARNAEARKALQDAVKWMKWARVWMQHETKPPLDRRRQFNEATIRAAAVLDHAGLPSEETR